MFVRADEDGLQCIIAIYVDDPLITARTDALVTEVKGLLKERFKIKELGPISWILGIAVERDFIKGTLIMHQQKYIMDLVERFGMENAAGRRTPYAGGDDKPSEDCNPADKTLYCNLAGSLMYAAVATRPDITETVNRLCKRMNSPMQADMKNAQRCLQYLKATANLGIQFTEEEHPKILCDANLGEHRRT